MIGPVGLSRDNIFITTTVGPRPEMVQSKIAATFLIAAAGGQSLGSSARVSRAESFPARNESKVYGLYMRRTRIIFYTVYFVTLLCHAQTTMGSHIGSLQILMWSHIATSYVIGTSMGPQGL